jgi:hypothetical protein
MLAENIQRGHYAVLVQLANQPHGVSHRIAGDITSRHPAHQRLWHQRQRRDNQFIEKLQSFSLPPSSQK